MKRLPLVPKSEGILLNRNEVMRARKAQQAVHWARKRASPGKLRNPDEDRIVLIEDTSEIHLEKPNLVRFEARQAQPDLPAITTRDLQKPSLRHRPDRIILGEIRGGEAFDLLQLLNTGNPWCSQPFTPAPLPKRFRDLRVAFLRAESNWRIAPLGPTSAIR